MTRSRPQNLQPRQFYHGTIADLEVGEHLEPPIKTGKQVWDVSDPEKVYMASKEDSAWSWSKAGNQYGTTDPSNPDFYRNLRERAPEAKPQWVYKVEPEYDVRADPNLHSNLGGYHIDQLTDEEKLDVDAWTAPRAKIKAKYPGPVGSQLRLFPDEAGRQYDTPQIPRPSRLREAEEWFYGPGKDEVGVGQAGLFNKYQFSENVEDMWSRRRRKTWNEPKKTPTNPTWPPTNPEIGQRLGWKD